MEEQQFFEFKKWYLKKVNPDTDARHHIYYRWKLDKHPKKIDLLFELWLENLVLKNSISLED